MRRQRGTRPQFRNSSGNVFTDLGVPDADQEVVKAELIKAICTLVSGEKRLRQVDVAARLGISQPKVSLLMRGHTAGFSTEMLIRLLNRLGQRIEIVVKPSRPGRLIGDTHVHYDAAMLLEHKAPAYGVGPVSRSARTASDTAVTAKRSIRVRTAKKK
jgi:predicted XRE-type DNA-binding protein